MTITDRFQGPVQPPDAASAEDRLRHRLWPVRLTAAVGESLGRLLLGGIFVAAAVMHLAAWQDAIAQAAQLGVPQPAPVLAIGTVVEALGGLSVMLGFETSLGALVLAAFTAAMTPVIDHFWRMNGADAELHLQVFMANLALLGALLIVAARGAGPWSLDAAHHRQRARR
jgi:putative oxidoreductase